jgi:hypothetical protein
MGAEISSRKVSKKREQLNRRICVPFVCQLSQTGRYQADQGQTTKSTLCASRTTTVGPGQYSSAEAISAPERLGVKWSLVQIQLPRPCEFRSPRDSGRSGPQGPGPLLLQGVTVGSRVGPGRPRRVRSTTPLAGLDDLPRCRRHPRPTDADRWLPSAGSLLVRSDR